MQRIAFETVFAIGSLIYRQSFYNHKPATNEAMALVNGALSGDLMVKFSKANVVDFFTALVVMQ